jgi:hypothetical protein
VNATPEQDEMTSGIRAQAIVLREAQASSR